MNHNIMNHGMRTSCLLVAGLLIATGTSAQASELIDNVPFYFQQHPFPATGSAAAIQSGI